MAPSPLPTEVVPARAGPVGLVVAWTAHFCIRRAIIILCRIRRRPMRSRVLRSLPSRGGRAPAYNIYFRPGAFQEIRDRTRGVTGPLPRPGKVSPPGTGGRRRRMKRTVAFCSCFVFLFPTR